jgi:hypothetical protein
LRDGDLIVIGGSRELRVKLAPRPLARLLTAVANRAALTALASAASVLLLAAVVAALLTTASPGEQESAGEGSAAANADAGPAHSPAHSVARPAPGAPAAEGSPAQAPDEEGAARNEGSQGRSDLNRIEGAAVQVLRRIGRGERPYALNDQTLEDISGKVEEYRESPHTGEALRQMRGGMPPVVARARSEGVEPALLAYAALALTDGGRSGRDPVAAARTLLPELAKLSRTLGGVGADSNLIVLAAYTEGVGTKRSHPLLSRIRQSVNRPLAERNVWYLHERGIINERAYGFVISFLACGIIAQDPRRFGVDAEALSL